VNDSILKEDPLNSSGDMHFARRRQLIAFVCLSNTSRGPIAEAFATAYGKPGLLVASFGVSPRDRVSRGAIDTVSNGGIDMSGDRVTGVPGTVHEDFDITTFLSEDVLRTYIGGIFSCESLEPEPGSTGNETRRRDEALAKFQAPEYTIM